MSSQHTRLLRKTVAGDKTASTSTTKGMEMSFIMEKGNGDGLSSMPPPSIASGQMLTEDGRPPPVPELQHNPRKITFINQTVETLHQYITSKSRPKRQKLTAVQNKELDAWFNQQSSQQLTSTTKKELAIQMGVSVRVIQEWYNEKRRQVKLSIVGNSDVGPVEAGLSMQLTMITDDKNPAGQRARGSARGVQKQRGRSRSGSITKAAAVPILSHSVTPPQTPVPNPPPQSQIDSFFYPQADSIDFRDPLSYQKLAPPSPLGWPHNQQQQQQQQQLYCPTTFSDADFNSDSHDQPHGEFNDKVRRRPIIARRHTITNSPPADSEPNINYGQSWANSHHHHQQHQQQSQAFSAPASDYDPILSDNAVNDIYENLCGPITNDDVLQQFIDINHAEFSTIMSYSSSYHDNLMDFTDSLDVRRRSFSDTAAFGGLLRYSPTPYQFRQSPTSTAGINDEMFQQSAEYTIQGTVDSVDNNIFDLYTAHQQH